MSDNAMKKSVRGAEKLLTWLGWTMLTAVLVAAFFAVFILPYLLLFLWGGASRPWGSSGGAEVVAFMLLIVQFLAWFYVLLRFSGWLGHMLQQLHEWAHTVNGRK